MGVVLEVVVGNWTYCTCPHHVSVLVPHCGAGKGGGVVFVVRYLHGVGVLGKGRLQAFAIKMVHFI